MQMQQPKATEVIFKVRLKALPNKAETLKLLVRLKKILKG